MLGLLFHALALSVCLSVSVPLSVGPLSVSVPLSVGPLSVSVPLSVGPLSVFLSVSVSLSSLSLSPKWVHLNKNNSNKNHLNCFTLSLSDSNPYTHLILLTDTSDLLLLVLKAFVLQSIQALTNSLIPWRRPFKGISPLNTYCGIRYQSKNLKLWSLRKKERKKSNAPLCIQPPSVVSNDWRY